jgi:hypothetical protein
MPPSPYQGAYLTRDQPTMRDFKGTISLDIRDSTPDWDAFLDPQTPSDVPNVLVIRYDDTGRAAWSPYGGRIQMPRSLTPYVGPEKPNDAPEGNWLPPLGRQNDSLTFRSTVHAEASPTGATTRRRSSSAMSEIGFGQAQP